MASKNLKTDDQLSREADKPQVTKILRNPETLKYEAYQCDEVVVSNSDLKTVLNSVRTGG